MGALEDIKHRQQGLHAITRLVDRKVKVAKGLHEVHHVWHVEGKTCNVVQPLCMRLEKRKWKEPTCPIYRGQLHALLQHTGSMQVSIV